jgi:hypothetical protein
MSPSARESDLVFEHRHRDGVRRRALAVDGVGHVALVIGAVEVDAVPATRGLVADVELASGGAGGREVPVVEALPALPAFDRARGALEVRLGRDGTADHEPEALGERAHGGVVEHAGLVVEHLRADRHDELVTLVDRGNQ